MKIVDGVNLHHIQTKKFKTNKLTVRFTGNRRKETVAKRVLVAQMLGLANQKYPTNQSFRWALADMYGTSLSTHVSDRGLYHLIDIDIDFLNDRYLLGQETILEEVFDILYNVLYNPLSTLEQFQSTAFDIEKENLINYLKADKEDSFYYSELGLHKLYYRDENLQVSRFADPKLVEQETSYTAYQELQRMLREDQIDIFLLGDLDTAAALDKLNQFPFQARSEIAATTYQQDKQAIIKEQLEQQSDKQSILQLAYNLPVRLSDDTYPVYQVLHSMLGAFSHSRLFTQVREKAGLAYSIGSQIDPYTGLLQIYAGIDSSKREQALNLINRQWYDFKLGRFSGYLLKQTKDLLIAQRHIAGDHPKYLIEKNYNRALFLNEKTDDSSWDERIQAVSKADIIAAARQCHLQAIYYLEGVE